MVHPTGRETFIWSTVVFRDFEPGRGGGVAFSPGDERSILEGLEVMLKDQQQDKSLRVEKIQI